MLAMTLVVATPAFAEPDFATAKPIPGYPDFEITDNGHLIFQGDVGVGKCGSTQNFAFLDKSLDKKAVRACEKAGFPVKGSQTQSPLPDTGGPPLTLVPIAFLMVGGLLLFRKSTAL